jgi:hypothetical protein
MWKKTVSSAGMAIFFSEKIKNRLAIFAVHKRPFYEVKPGRFSMGDDKNVA